MAKSERIEIRTELERKTRLEAAAAVAEESVSQFVLDAAIEKADQILGPGPVDLWPAHQFDALLAALDEPARTLPKLAQVHARERRSRRVTS